jgi:hypothetical protein
MGMAFHAKPGKKIDALDMDTLLHDQTRREQRIESAGNQGHGFILFAHTIAGAELFRVRS